jgi:hypothetical protein
MFLKLAVWNNDRIVGDQSHARYYDLHSVLDYFQCGTKAFALSTKIAAHMGRLP